MPTTTTSRRYRALLDPLAYPAHTGPHNWESEGWKLAHNNAVRGPRPNEQPVRDLILSWLAYADQHETQWNDPPTDPLICALHSETYAESFRAAQSTGFNGSAPLPPADDLACSECSAKYEATVDPANPSAEHYRNICQHCNRCTSRIGDDYVLGAAWEAIGHELLTLLNGDLGRLDGGTLDHCIRQALTYAGLDAD